MKTVFAIAATAATFAATPALADAPVGPRVEVLAGYDKVSADLGNGLSLSRDGAAFAANLGYDVALGSVISAGVDAEVGVSTTKFTYADATNNLRIKAGRDLYVGGRLTAAVSPAVNLYAKVGYTNARLSGTLNGVNDAAHYDGIRLGAGAQVALMGPVYGLLEYRYSNYEADVTRNQILAGVGFRF